MQVAFAALEEETDNNMREELRTQLEKYEAEIAELKAQKSQVQLADQPATFFQRKR